MVETHGHCLALHAGHASRVSCIRHDYFGVSNIAHVSRTSSILILLDLLASITLGYQVLDNFFKLLLADRALHDKVHFVEGFNECLIVVLLFELFVEVEFKGKVLLDVLGDFSSCVAQ